MFSPCFIVNFFFNPLVAPPCVCFGHHKAQHLIYTFTAERFIFYQNAQVSGTIFWYKLLFSLLLPPLVAIPPIAFVAFCKNQIFQV